jgi:hypothetical protein
MSRADVRMPASAGADATGELRPGAVASTEFKPRNLIVLGLSKSGALASSATLRRPGAVGRMKRCHSIKSRRQCAMACMPAGYSRHCEI